MKNSLQTPTIYFITPSMHQLFQVRELVDFILWNLRADEDLGSLARMARTSKSLGEPALDVLWYELDSIHPLLYLLSNIKPIKPKKQPRIIQPPEQFHLMGPTSLSDRIRLQKYAQKVRQIQKSFRYLSGSRSKTYSRTVSKEVWDIFVNGLGRSPLPELRTLEWPFTGCCTDDRTSVIDILGPKLLRFIVWDPAYVSPHGSLDGPDLEALAIRSPSLEQLHICRPGKPVSKGLAMLQDLKQLRTIHFVYFWPNLTFWSALAELPRLQDLRCSIDFVGHRAASVPPNDNAFPSLKTLELKGNSLGCSSLLSCFDLPRLMSLELNLLSDFKESGTPSFFNAIMSRFSTEFTTLTLVYCEVIEPKRFPHITSSTMHQLTCRFPNIVKIYFIGTWCFELVDEDLQHMARSWPQLKFLHLNPDAKWPLSTKPTLASLECFADNCPHLVTLSMQLDADGSYYNPSSSSKFDGKKQVNGRRLKRLNTLNIGTMSTIKHPLQVAAFLFRHFPQLTQIQGKLSDLEAAYNNPKSYEVLPVSVTGRHI
ncbi:hypothetical protein ABKN59_007991 [Abortiporus biennis]